VVATVGLLATTLRVGAVSAPIGQPEYIATDPDHQGRGLAGRLLAKVQKWSEDRGDLVQIIGGVPYFYRQYGYSYGLIRPPELAVAPEQELAMPAGWQVRAADEGDIDRIRALQQMAQAGVDVALPFADNLWPAFLKLPAALLLVAVKEGRLGAVARLRFAPGWPLHVQALAADEVDAAGAVLAGARARHPGTTQVIAEREGSAVRAVVGARATLVAGRKWFYTRVPSLARLLRALIPVLDDRLSRSGLAGESGQLDISIYRSSVRLQFDRGRIVEVTEGPAIHEPDDVGTVGIPPDLVPQLLFGEGGVLGIEDHPDVYLDRFRPLMAALFPPLRVDLLTW
jgi:hypothetical protein